MENRDTLVSIIVPVYGVEAYLPACIESLCKQSYSNIQIILVDDQSPDGCPEICDKYAQKDSRILVIHQKNTGVSGARNTGMRAACGEYIMFVDSDDELYPDAVEILLQDAREYGADIVSGLKKVVDKNGKAANVFDDKSITVFQNDQPVLLSLEGDRNTNSACAKLFRAGFIDGISFEEGKNIHEDGFFIFLCYLRKPVLVQHNIYMYQYNTRAGSGSRQIFSENHFSMLYFCDKKKTLIAELYPQHIDCVHNMEVRTHLQFLDLLCSTEDKKYLSYADASVKTVCNWYSSHRPINEHHKKLAWIVAHGMYSIYRLLKRIKYHR